jgi:hypothetical protein
VHVFEGDSIAAEQGAFPKFFESVFLVPISCLFFMLTNCYFFIYLIQFHFRNGTSTGFAK